MIARSAHRTRPCSGIFLSPPVPALRIDNLFCRHTPLATTSTELLSLAPHTVPFLNKCRGSVLIGRSGVGSVTAHLAGGQHATKCYVCRDFSAAWRAWISTQVEMNPELTSILLGTRVNRNYRHNLSHKNDLRRFGLRSMLRSEVPLFNPISGHFTFIRPANSRYGRKGLTTS